MRDRKPVIEGNGAGGGALPLVAALIATCNRPALLASRALTSIQAQTRPPDYLVVVDDSDPGYRADNRNIVNDVRLAGTRVFYRENSRAKGAAGAWNTGLDWLQRTIQSPESVFVAILDDDDEWDPGYLAACWNAAEAQRLDMVAASICRVAEGAPDRIQPPPASVEASLFLRGNPHIQGSNLFVRLARLLEAGGFDEALSSSTDRDLCVRLVDLGDLRYGVVEGVLARHYTSDGHARLSTPGSIARQRGLGAFWAKWRSRMTAEEASACADRAQRYFGWSPPPEEVAPGTQCPMAPAVPVSDSQLKHEGDLVLVVGVIGDDEHVSQLDRLLSDLQTIRRSRHVSCLDVVVLANGDHCQGLKALVERHRAQGTSIFLATREDQIASASASRVPHATQPAGRMPIAQSRDLLHAFVRQVASRRPGAIAWILDDDSNFDNVWDGPSSRTMESLVVALPRLRKHGVQVLLGTVTGDPPVPPGTTVRTQFVDLHHNLSWLGALDPAAPLPDRSEENRRARRSAGDFYYDLSRRDTKHLEWPFWVTPQRPGETVGEAFSRLARSAERILAGQTVTRVLVADPELEVDDSLVPSVQRGTNAFVLDLVALDEFPHLVPKFSGHVLRRSDMIWSLLNRYAGGRRIVRSRVPVRHDRSDEPAVGIDHERLVPDVRGYALYSALDDVLTRRRIERQKQGLGAEVTDDLRFDEQNVALGLSRYRKYVQERTAALLLACWRVQGLCRSLRHLLTGAAGAHHFFVRLEEYGSAVQGLLGVVARAASVFNPAEVGSTVAKILDVPDEEVRRFFADLGAAVRAHQSTGNADLAAAWFTRERVASAQALARLQGGGDPALLGMGSEGVVFAIDQRAVKVIDYAKRSEASGAWRGLERLLSSDAQPTVMVRPQAASAAPGRRVLSYPFEPGVPYAGGDGHGMLELMRDCRRAGVVASNVHPKNLLRTSAGLRFIDVGSDIREWSEAGFHSMAQRVFLSMHSWARPDLADLMRQALREPVPRELEGWEAILAAVDPPTMDELVHEAILNRVGERPPGRVLDHGCGKGGLARSLAARGWDVVAYDPDPMWTSHWGAEATGSPIRWIGEREQLHRVLTQGPFDLVVSSMVLCTLEQATEYVQVLDELAAALAPEGVFCVGICNPRAALRGDTSLCRRAGPTGAETHVFSWRKLLPNGVARTDVHRPLARVLGDLGARGLHASSATYTGGVSLDSHLPSHDFLILSGGTGAASGLDVREASEPQRARARTPVEVRVLCYHRVLPEGLDDAVSPCQRERGMVVDEPVFSRHMETIRSQLSPVTLAMYLDWLDGRAELPDNACLVTFDDGYRDFKEHALPTLARLAIPCVMFPTLAAASRRAALPVDDLYARLGVAHASGALTEAGRSDWVAGTRKRAYIRAAAPARRAMLDEFGVPEGALDLHDLYLQEADLRALPADLVAVGGHGVQHDLLTELGLSALRVELRRVYTWIRGLQGNAHDGRVVLAYPNGSHSPTVVGATIEAGFSAAFTVRPWQTGIASHRWSLRRSCIPNRASAIEDLVAGREVKV